MRIGWFLVVAACAAAPKPEPVTPIVLPASPAASPLPCAENEGERCRAGCDAGKQDDCAVLASMHYTGNGAPIDLARARALAESSCNANVLRGCNVLALLYEKGEGGVPKDEAKATELYRRVCDGKEWRGCANLGRLRLVNNDSDPAGIDFHERACRLGGASSCLAAGSRLAPGQPNPSPYRAAAMFRIGCDAGDLDACNGLGTCYARGEGVPQDNARAIELFTKACDGNVGIGCKGLGDMFATTDPVRAQAAYKRSCDLGYKRGCEHVTP
jgi:TPR repeat protein